MDGTLETLNIQITADTTKAKNSIASLRESLGRLDTTLGSFKNIGRFSQGMSTLASAVTEFSSSINSIDATKLQRLADAMKTLSSATRGISKGASSLSFTQAESEANGFKKQIDTLTSTISKDFGISKRDADGLRERIVALAKATNELSTAKGETAQNAAFDKQAQAYQDLMSYIENTKRVVYDFGGAYDTIVEKVRGGSNGMKVSIKSMVSDIGEDYDKLRRKLSNTAFTTKDSGFGFDSFMKGFNDGEMALINEEIQRTGGIIGSTQSQFEALVSIMERWRATNVQGAASADWFNSTEEGLTSTVTSAVAAFNELSIAEGRVATIGQTETVNTFYSMAQGLKQFESVNLTNVGQIAELSKAIKTLGYTSSEKAITNIPKLASALNGLMATLSKAPTVSGKVNKLLDSLARFNESMKTYNATARQTKTSNGMLNTSFLNLNKGVNRANTGFKGLASTIGKIYATYWLFFRLFSKIGEAINISSQLTEVENVVNQTFGNMRSKIDEFAKVSINKFGMSELAMKQYASRFQAMGTAMDITGSMLEKTTAVLGDADRQYGKLTGSMAEMSLNLTKLTADMASFYDVEQSAVAEDLYSVFTGQTRSLRQYGIDLTQVNLKEWAMKKGLDANLDAMTQAQKAALRYAYTLDAAKYAMGDFERTSDTWANSVRILKANLQQLAIVIGQGFINALKPLLRALNTALQAITSFCTKVLNALGQIFGWKYEINLGGVTTDLDDAAGAADDLSGGLGDSAKKAKELKNQLRGFDKLNLLTTNDDSSGSGGGSASGGGGGAIDDSSLINAAKVSEGFFKSAIKDLESLGKYISNTISKQLESINWNAIYEKARNFGTGLADFLNGMFAGEAGRRLFSNVGKSVASALNVVGEAIYSFAKEFKWKEYGRNLATGLNKFFKTWKPVLAASAFYKMADGILDAIIEALDTVEWEMIGEKIGQFLAHLNFEKIVKKMAIALGKAISGIWKMVKVSFEEAPIETLILTAFAAIKFTKLGNLIATMMITKLFGKDGIVRLWLNGIGIDLLSNAKILVGFGKNIVLNSIAKALGCTASAAGTMLMTVTILLAVDVALAKINDSLHEKWAREILGGDEWDALKEDIDSVSESVKGFTESLKYMNQEYKDSLGNADQDAKDIQKLADRYFELADKTNLTAKEKEQLKTVAESLISYIPELSDLYNEQTGYIDANKDAIQQMTDAYVESIKQAAKTEYLTSLYKKQYEAYGNMAKAWEDYQKSLEGYDEKVAELEKKIAFYARTGGAKKYKDDLAELNETVSNARNTFYEAADGVNELGSNIYNLSGDDSVTAMNMILEQGGESANGMAAALKGLNTDIDKTTQKAGESKKAIEDSTNTSKTNIDTFTKSANANLDSTKKKSDELDTSIGNVKKQSDMSGAKSNIQDFTSISDKNLQGTKKNTDNLFDAVGSLKTQSNMSGASSNIQSFTSITDRGMQGTKKNVDDAKTSVDNMKTSTQDLLKYNNQTFTINKNDSAFKSLGDALSGFLQALRDIFSFNGQTVTINQVTNATTTGGGKRKADGGIFSGGHWQNISKYASGGLPSAGQMFIAREAGPELVGTLGGNTAVMNNDQIVASVSNGVYQAVASAMRQYGGANVNVTLQGDAGDLFRAVQTESNRYFGRTGRSPFPT